MNDLDKKIRCYLVKKSAELLKIHETEVAWESDIDEYGYDSMTVNGLCLEINELFNIYVQPSIFLEYPSLSEFSHYMKKKFYSQLEGVLLNEERITY